MESKTTTPKATGKRFSNVNEMVKAISKDSAFKKEFDKEFNAKKVVRMLASSRAARGMTQSDLAKKIGCGQPRISKIENGRDEQLKIQDLVDYAKALDLQINTVFNAKQNNAVEEIKYHAFEIKSRLDRLAELANKDDTIFEGVSGFFGEYFFNMLNIFEGSIKKLPKKKKGQDLIDVFTDLPRQNQQSQTAACK